MLQSDEKMKAAIKLIKENQRSEVNSMKWTSFSHVGLIKILHRIWVLCVINIVKWIYEYRNRLLFEKLIKK
jgi:hypothetical protein